MKSFKNSTILSGPKLLIAGLVVVVVVLLALNSNSAPSTPEADLSATSGTPILTMPVTKAELGNVSMQNGVAEQVFSIRNDGDGPLRIGALDTSCMCTTAKLEVGGTMSPAFGMPGHGGSASRSWAMDIPPGEEGTLHVYYDPNAHGPSGVGPFSRDISFTTNDTNAPRSSVKISGVTVR